MDNIFNSAKLAVKIKRKIEKDLAALKKRKIIPGLVSVIAGGHSPSLLYANSQKDICAMAGVSCTVRTYPENISQERMFSEIHKLNRESTVTGIIVQTPLPKQIDAPALRRRINPKKDVEGVNPFNLGRLISGDLRLMPATAGAVWEIIKESGISLKGKNAVIIGHSATVGKPLAMIMLSSPESSPTVTICHIATKNLKEYTKKADILISAAGCQGLIKKNFVKRGAFVIDVGINKSGNGITGDVDFDNVRKTAGLITPVPGGVGPITVLMLICNLITLAENKI